MVFGVYMRPKPERCAQCHTPIDQPATGRSRQVCLSPDCRRKAAAERRRLQRRRSAAIPVNSWRHDRNRQPAPRGGHEPLVRRLARQLAVEAFPHATVTAEELDALELAIQAGAVTSDDIERIVKGHDPRAYPPLEPVRPEARARLKRLIERNTANDPISERHRQLMAELRQDPARALRAFGTTN